MELQAMKKKFAAQGLIAGTNAALKKFKIKRSLF